jgi:hypothetical protein
VHGLGGENGLSRGKSMSGEKKAYQAAKSGAWAAKTKTIWRAPAGTQR